MGPRRRIAGPCRVAAGGRFGSLLTPAADCAKGPTGMAAQRRSGERFERAASQHGTPLGCRECKNMYGQVAIAG